MLVTAKTQTPICLLTLGLALMACTNRRMDCHWNEDCPIVAGSSSVAGGDQGGNGGASNNGGSTTKGGTTSSGTTAVPCDGSCKGSTPVCDTSTDKCVECVRDTHCKDSSAPVCDTANNSCVGCLKSADCTTDATKPVCNTASNACVACLGNTDCKDAAASLCDTSTNTCGKCSVDADCGHIPGKGVCDAGTCVQCTGKKYAACGQSNGKDLVCDSLSHTCATDKTVQSSGLCQPCISDAQCNAGKLCYQETFNSAAVGYFCFWKQGDTANGAPTDCTLSTNRPYVKIESAVTSIDGESATLCTLAASTCTAYNQFRNIDCAPTGTPQDGLCGFAAGLDSKCMPFGSTTYRCTTVCASNDDCLFNCDAGTSPRVCTFQ